MVARMSPAVKLLALSSPALGETGKARVLRENRPAEEIPHRVVCVDRIGASAEVERADDRAVVAEPAMASLLGGAEGDTRTALALRLAGAGDVALLKGDFGRVGAAVASTSRIRAAQ